MKEMQAEDSDLGSIVEWIQTGRCPTEDYLKTKSRDTGKLWAQVPAVYLLDGILVQKPTEEAHIQLVVPHKLQKRLFEVTYAGPLAAHLGAEKNVAAIENNILLARNDKRRTVAVPPM